MVFRRPSLIVARSPAPARSSRGTRPRRLPRQAERAARARRQRRSAVAPERPQRAGDNLIPQDPPPTAPRPPAPRPAPRTHAAGRPRGRSGEAPRSRAASAPRTTARSARALRGLQRGLVGAHAADRRAARLLPHARRAVPQLLARSPRRSPPTTRTSGRSRSTTATPAERHAAPGAPLRRQPARSACQDKTQSTANLRLRLNPEIHISDNLRIMSQIDLLDNLVLGSTPDAYAHQAERHDGTERQRHRLRGQRLQRLRPARRASRPRRVRPPPA